MDPMFLSEIEGNEGGGGYAELIRLLRGMGAAPPQIFHMFAFRPQATDHLARFTQEAMRGESPLSPGMRELIAAFTSQENHCLF